jgi:hypothetical protein
MQFATTHHCSPRGKTIFRKTRPSPDARNGPPAVRRLALIGGVAVAIAAAAWFAWFLQHSRFMEIDRCLDAGGAWDDEQQACRTE